MTILHFQLFQLSEVFKSRAVKKGEKDFVMSEKNVNFVGRT